MTDYQTLILEQTDHVALVRMNRVDARNALSPSLIEELTHVAHSLKRQTDLKAVILTGTDRFFSAGADLSTLETHLDPAQDLLTLRDRLRAGPDMCRAWEEIEAVTIAALEGFCVGGACSLVLACDFRIAAQGAMMRLPEVPLGMNMSWQTLPRLTNLVGPSRAKQFAIFGDPTPDETLKEWGLIDQLVPQGAALAEAQKWADRVSALPPAAVRMTKETISAVASAGQSAISHMDRDQFLLTALSGQIKVEPRKP